MKEYVKDIKGTIKKYSDFKFANFLSNVICLISSEQLQGLPETPTSSRVRKYSVQLDLNFSAKAAAVNSESLTFRGDEFEDDYRILTKGNLQDKLFNYLGIEIMKKDSFFFEIVHKFSEEFTKKYQELANKYEELYQNITETSENASQGFSVLEMKTLYKNAIKDVKEFLLFLCDTFLVFVKQMSISTLNTDFLVPRDRKVERLATRLLFGKNDIYEIVFKLIRLNSKHDEHRLKRCFILLKDAKPHQFNVASSFCFSDDDSPYQHVIDCINYLDVFTNPYDKFDAIFRMRREIMTAIDQYLGKRPEIKLPKSKLLLSADQLVPIYCYCLANCGNSKMRAHQIFIEEFIHEHMMKYGEEAYYFTTFTAAVDFLMTCSENPSKVLNNQKN